MTTSEVEDSVQVFHDPLQIIHVACDESFAVELAGNPTTGYTWQPDRTEPALALIGQEFHPEAPGMGAGGREIFHFHALKPGQAELAFAYRRPWGGPVRDTRRFQVLVE
jgi:predicted secreted protein